MICQAVGHKSTFEHGRLPTEGDTSPASEGCPAPPPVPAGSVASHWARSGRSAKPRCFPWPPTARPPTVRTASFNSGRIQTVEQISPRVTDLLEVPGFCFLLVLASNSFVLDPQLSHGGTQIRALWCVHLHVHLLVSQTRFEGIHLL